MEKDFTPRELKGKRLIGYSMGDLGMSLTNIFTGIFTFQFYVYTINLNSILVSVGVSTQIIVGAIFSILFGIIIDNKKPGKLGKRRPFLLIGLPIWAITSIIIWLPPQYCPEGNSMYLPTAVYFWVVSLIRSISRSLLFNVYSSMLPEQSQTLKNRETIASIRVAFAIIASVLALFMPLMVQSFLPDPTAVKWWEPSGKIILFYIPIISIFFVIFGIVSILMIYISADESFHKIEDNYEKKKISFAETFQQMALPAKDSNFRKLIIGGFFIGISMKTFGLLIFPFQTYLLNFTSAEFYFYVLVSLCGKFSLYFFWKRMLRKNRMVKNYSLGVILSSIAGFLGLFFLLGFLSYEIKIFLFIITFGVILGDSFSFPLFTIPITATLVHKAAENLEESDVDKGMSKISGAYYGLATFTRSLGPAFASIFVGIILSGANEENPTIIALVFSSIGIFYLIAFLIIRRLKSSLFL